MAATDRVTGLVTLLLGVFVTILSAQMSLLSKGVPGAGLLPLFTGLSLVLFGAILLVRPGHQAPSSEAAPDAGWRVAGTVGALVVFTAAVPIVGFPIATALFLTGLIWWWGDYRWWMAALISVPTALAMMLVFQVLLHAPLPGGIWG